MTHPLPKWAAELQAIGMDEAALVLGVCRRTLTTILKNHPHYDKRGRFKKVFKRHHIEALEAVKWDSTPDLTLKPESTNYGAPSQDGALEKALRLATGGRQDSPRKPLSEKSGQVLPMVRPKQ